MSRDAILSVADKAAWHATSLAPDRKVSSAVQQAVLGYQEGVPPCSARGLQSTFVACCLSGSLGLNSMEGEVTSACQVPI